MSEYINSGTSDICVKIHNHIRKQLKTNYEFHDFSLRFWGKSVEFDFFCIENINAIPYVFSELTKTEKDCKFFIKGKINNYKVLL